MRRLSNRGLSILAGIVFLWAAYRAVAMAITPPEAITYNHYASRPVMEILTSPFHPANQVLHTLLCHLVFRLFRVTEWALRLPGLVGLLFYFWAAVRLCRAVCRSDGMALVCAAVFIANPFTIGWLPVAGGAWAGAGCFLIAVRLFAAYWGDPQRHTILLTQASFALGLASGLHISYSVLSIGLILLFLHFSFWRGRMVKLSDAGHRLILPFALLTFSLWCIPLLNIREPFRIEWLCVILLPGLVTLSIPWLVQNRTLSLVSAALALVLAFALVRGNLPDLFHQGPEAGMPKVARALRDQIRRGQVHAIEVKTHVNLIEPMNFYRKRYALGAVQPIRPETSPESAEYLILPSTAPPPAGTTKLFENRGIVLWMRNGA